MTRVPLSVPDWHEQAACQLFPELDFVDAKPGSPQEWAARIICAACPVRLRCATGALERGEPWGVWGGLTRRDRVLLAVSHGYPRPAMLPEHGTNSRRVKHGCTCPDCRRAHACYEADRRARARAKARRRGVWVSLVVTRACRINGRRQCPGQYVLPLDLPARRRREPVEPALPTAA